MDPARLPDQRHRGPVSIHRHEHPGRRAPLLPRQLAVTGAGTADGHGWFDREPRKLREPRGQERPIFPFEYFECFAVKLPTATLGRKHRAFNPASGESGLAAAPRSACLWWPTARCVPKSEEHATWPTARSGSPICRGLYCRRFFCARTPHCLWVWFRAGDSHARNSRPRTVQATPA